MDSTLRIFRKPILLHDLENFPLLDQDRCSRLGAGFSILRIQYVTLIRIREKMVDLGEKMKTHVSKNSSGSRARNQPQEKLKSHKGFQRRNTQNIKMGFSPCLLSISSFPKLSSVFQSDEQKPRYLNLKILAQKLKGHSRLAQKSQNSFFPISSFCLIELITNDGIRFG